MTVALWWLVAGAVMVLLELVIPGVFIFFFGLAALLTGGLCWLFPALSFPIQLLIFVFLGSASIFGCRRWIPRSFRGKIIASEQDVDSDDVAGSPAFTLEPITPNSPGKVEFRGTLWTAVSEREIPAGARVKVKCRKNLVLEVE